jgi:hypothetical protein
MQTGEVIIMSVLNTSALIRRHPILAATSIVALTSLLVYRTAVTAQQSTSAFRPIRLLAAQPAITDAPLKSARDAEIDLNPDELVIGVIVGKEPRAYPINMLTGPSREIINDTLGGQGIAATW